ncbi:twitch domain-containing radical SAM protein [bacterium]|nr:twitch domain-containing radical SAM protein [bacterium]
MERRLPEKFCMAPFVHMYVHSNESERVCCMTTEAGGIRPNEELDLTKRWNSEHLKNIRRQFLANREPDICTKCFSNERAGGISDRMRFNDMYVGEINPDVVTGNQYGSPIDLDIRPGNLCNLGCRMCGPISSSTIQKETQKNPLMQDIMGKGDIVTTDVLKNANNLEFLLRNADKGKRIKFLGGEPTIMPEVDEFLNILMERNMLDVPLHFTTNCTNGNKRFIDKISKFNKVSFNYSVDGIGKVVEYIRHPVKFNSINTNIQTYAAIAVHGEISFTLQAYNFFNLVDTIKWSSALDISLRPEILMHPDPLSYKSIPLKIRRKRIPLMIKMIEDIPLSGSISRTQVKLKALPALERIYEDNEEYSLQDIARHTKIIDTVRKQHIKDYVPEVWDFIKEEYHAIQL